MKVSVVSLLLYYVSVAHLHAPLDTTSPCKSERANTIFLNRYNLI